MERDMWRRGLPWYGMPLGIAMLDGTCAAPVGDVGNAASYAFPTQYDLVTGIDGPDLTAGTRRDVEDAFVASAERLAARGARILGTGCGMLGQYQGALAARSPIPIATSSLIQVPAVLRLIAADSRVLVLGADSRWIRREHLLACGVQRAELDRVVIRGMDTAEHFRANLMGGIDEYDPAIGQAEALSAIEEAIAEEPAIAAIVFECTNLGPFSAAARRRFDLPVWDAIGLLDWLHSAVADS